MRIFVQIILPLITPIVIYTIWSYWDAKRNNTKMPGWEEGHWFWVLVLGFVLAVASLIIIATLGAEPGTEYMPPVLKDGNVVPGQYK